MVTAAIIQARMGSSRLPGKSLAELGDGTVLDWVVTRARQSTLVDEVIVATSDLREDDRVAEHCRATGTRCVRGDALDVLARYDTALQHSNADTIVRLTADCPFVDPAIVDHVIRTLGVGDSNPAAYVSTSLDGRYPRGLDVEAMQRRVLEVAHREATDDDEREHVTLFIYRRPSRFDCRPATAPAWARRADLRFTVDEPRDLELVRAIVSTTRGNAATLTGAQIVAALDAHPEIARLNADVVHRNVS